MAGIVFSGDKGPILINNLQKYERNIIQDLDEAPQYLFEEK